MTSNLNSRARLSLMLKYYCGPTLSQRPKLGLQALLFILAQAYQEGGTILGLRQKRS